MIKALLALGAVAAGATAKTLNSNEDFFIYDRLFQQYGRRYLFPWRWLKAIAMNESDLGKNPLVAAGLVSSDGLSYGLMQVTLTTARDMDPAVTPAKLNNEEYSIKLGANYLRQMYLRYGGDRRKTIMAYNQGPGNTDKGKEYAAEYYERFVRNLTKVLEVQPGDQYE